MTVEFKFNIGDKVRHVLQPKIEFRSRLNGDVEAVEETLGVVTGRLAEECPGGIQLHYRLRWMFPATNASPPNIGAKVETLHEIELEKVED